MHPIPNRPTLPDGVAAQHGHLAAMIRSLRVRLSQGAEWEELAEAFDRLLADIAQHFQDEERLMHERHYPGLDAHRLEHVQFRAKVEKLRQECERKRTELLDVLVEMLETWFKNHEDTADRAVAAFLRAGE